MPPGAPPLVGALVEAFDAERVDLAALGLAWARCMPTVTLVPAFGLRALPLPARMALGLVLAVSIFPALRPLVAQPPGPWLLLALAEVVRGLPYALAAAVPLWAATMAGGVGDALRGAQDTSGGPTVEGRASPLGVTFSLFACALFLATGGPSKVVLALALSPPGMQPVSAIVQALVGGITLAVAVAGPLLASSVVVEVAGGLVARAASPAQVQTLLAPVRALALLAVAGLVLDRMATALATAR
jgi:flagellar biosynthesis protein FliR